MSRTKIAIGLIVAIIVLAASFVTITSLTNFEVKDSAEYGSRSLLVPEARPPSTRGGNYETVQTRMVIYNGQISLETGDIPGTLDKIRSFAERNGGYVASTSRSATGTQGTAEMTIRIPQDKFRMAVSELGTYGKVLDERTTSEDVTERYIDLKARLNNLQMEEQSLVELLAKTKTVDEILRVEQELARVRGEVESLQGQINYLDRNVAMSMITMSLREPTPPFKPPAMNWAETLEIAIRGFFEVIRILIVLAISVLPLVIIIGIPAYLIRRRSRKKAQTKT